jgi:hypothetical protein
VNVSVPVGVLLVPDDVSATVAEQLDAWPITTGVSHALIPVEVVRLFTVTAVAAAVLLVLCVASPPYEAVMFIVPSAVGVKLAEQAPLLRVQA